MPVFALPKLMRSAAKPASKVLVPRSSGLSSSDTGSGAPLQGVQAGPSEIEATGDDEDTDEDAEYGVDNGRENENAAIEYADDPPNSEIAMKRQKFLSILEEQGLLALAELIMGASAEQRDLVTLSGMNEEERVLEALEVLFCTHSDVLRSVIRGTLLPDCVDQLTRFLILDKMQTQTNIDKHPQPAIYENLLVDDQGFSPTPNELLQALNAREACLRGTHNRSAHRGDILEALKKALRELRELNRSD
ncbi:uncharacterized protein MYCFIDRAFT_79095 [Pseudocercospora fijiensis CIRAD86]|uniref:Uncharacterized protein n=1 Tax=Pseudocercospora fijiensis (strain CIRAD86) TaxID=383855 RepID=M2ZFD8_PSEFD|nr:uncharacterized protein MYCFIDRAFT_79095 [Pseudocercospora fijiensis CIRAD86]EME77839.1 hypothetical protein MYCFIDRAFT_79095 [Pseudocercospora fijiensis CIRAD86]